MTAEKTRFDAMAYGPLGKAVRDAMPHTEADPIGVLAAVLALYSAALNGNVRQPNGRPVVVWTALAGRSKIGRKGYALGTAEAILSDSVGDFLSVRTRQGLSSGPALVTTLYEAVESSRATETGPDGRIMVVDEEWSATLKRTNRCPTYSSVFRTAWDGKRVVNTTKGKTPGERDEQAVERPALGFHAHIQPGAWAKYISQAEALGGSYNRILPVLTERSKLLPTSDENPLDSIKPSSALRLAYEWACKQERAMTLSPAARRLYDELRAEYEDEMAEMPESLSCFVERSDENVLRVACVLTAAFRKTVITKEAIEAAKAFVEFSIDSVKQLVTEAASFAARPVMALDDRIRKVLREKGPLSRTHLYRALGSGRFSADMIMAEVEAMPDVVAEKQVAEGRSGQKPVIFRLIEQEDQEQEINEDLTAIKTPAAAARTRSARKAATSKAPAKPATAAKTPAARKSAARPPAKKTAAKRTAKKPTTKEREHDS
ncbi:hypothetical protein [Streptomyces sp. NPDC059874]|uniref:hypothetical protein n=1 Tax=Streptomyces sp. NPDC059874 TaxID=3346983 RepID=UPI003653E586